MKEFKGRVFVTSNENLKVEFLSLLMISEMMNMENLFFDGMIM